MARRLYVNALLAVAPVLATLARAPAALAWGGDGHRVVARIAETRIGDDARAGVRDLLGNASLVDVAAWADEVRGDRPDTGPWHYVNIPIDAAAGFDPARDGRGGANIVTATERAFRTVSNRAAARERRVEALKFLVHLVGDLHQPLHAGDRGDQGGNARLVFYPQVRKAVSLHHVWDTPLVDEAMGRTGLGVYASALNARVRPADVAGWAAGTAADWANESHRAAVDYAYAGVPADGPPPKLSPQYVAAAVPVVEGRLQRAGVRLAWLLDRSLGSLNSDAPANDRWSALTEELPDAPSRTTRRPDRPRDAPPATVPPDERPQRLLVPIIMAILVIAAGAVSARRAKHRRRARGW